MFWLKACPKCHGDLYNSKDAYGSFIACMQCSRYLTPAEEAELVLATARPGLSKASVQQDERVAA